MRNPEDCMYFFKRSNDDQIYEFFKDKLLKRRDTLDGGNLKK
jgi:hypothetical protein